MVILKFQQGQTVRVTKHETAELVGRKGTIKSVESSPACGPVKWHVNLGSDIPGGEPIEAECRDDQLEACQ